MSVYHIMKKNKFIILLALSIAFTSCSTTSNVVKEDVKNETKKVSEIVTESHISDKNVSKKNRNIVEIVIQNQPAQTIVGNNFKSPYEIQAFDEEKNPIVDLPITVSYPSSNKNSVVSFSTQNLFTDKNGMLSFMPAKATFSANSLITFYPTPDNTKSESVKLAMNNSESAKWSVKSNIVNKGAVLFIWNYNELNKPVNNAYEILSELRKDGVSMVGNAPVNETSYINADSKVLYKQNYSIIENSFGYLIAGTVKFVTPVEKINNEYSCTLIAEIRCIDMSNGNELLSFSITNTATGINWNECVSKCRSEIAEKVSDEIIYNL